MSFMFILTGGLSQIRYFWNKYTVFEVHELHEAKILLTTSAHFNKGLMLWCLVDVRQNVVQVVLTVYLQQGV